MSVNQSRTEKSDSSQYRKSGRSGSSGQPRNFSGGGGRGGGGGTAPPPSSSSPNSPVSSFKKSNNAQGGQSRATGASVNSDSKNTYAARAMQNGAHLQPQLRGASDAPATGITVNPSDVLSQKRTRAVPKAPSSHPVTVSSGTTTPATPVKAPGDASRPYPTLQFGTISPGVMNGMQVPARTSSAPPNLVEQKREQARHDSVRMVPTIPVTSAFKQQLPKKDVGGIDQSITGEAPPIPNTKRSVQVSSVPPATQPHKPSVRPVAGMSMLMPFHQSQVPIQFGGPNLHMQSQGMGPTSMPLPMPMPLPMGNPQMQQQVFISSLQPHGMQPPQGMMHPGQSLNYPSQMGPQLPHQMGNLGITPQFPQQQAGKFGRTAVKITHPETHEELRLDRRTESYMESGSSGQRSHPNVPTQPQPISSFQPTHAINYYPNSYNSNTLYFQAPSSIPLNSSQITTSSQAPRFSYPVSQSPQTAPFVNQLGPHSFAVNTVGAPSQGIVEPLKSEHARDVHNVITSAPSAPVQVTVKPVSGLFGVKVADSSLSIGSPYIEKDESPELPKPHGDSETSLKQSKLGHEPMTTLVPVESKQSVPASTTVSAETPTPKAFSPAPIKEPSKKPEMEGTSELQNQVGKESISGLSLPSQSSEHSSSVTTRTPETVEAETIFAYASDSKTNIVGDILDTDHHSQRDDFSLQDEQKVETVTTKEPAEVMSHKGSEQVRNCHETSLGSISSDSSEVGNINEKESAKLVTAGNEVGPEEPGGLTGDLTDSIVLDPINAENSRADLNSSTTYDNDKTSTLDASSGTSDSVGSEAVTKSGILDPKVASVSTLSLSEVTLTGEDIENSSSGSVSSSASVFKDIPMLEPNMGKTNMARGKKKRKEILLKADSLGTTSDLYGAYKGPEEKKEIVDSFESTSSNNLQPTLIDASQDISNEKGEQSKAEPDDWEDAADVPTTKLETLETVSQLQGEDDSGLMAKKYSRDFLLKFSEQCTNLPEGFEITSDIAEALVGSNVSVSRDSYPSPGRIVDRSSGGSRSDRHGRGVGEDDKWSKLHGAVSSGRDLRLDIGYGGNLVGFRPGQGGNYGVLRNPGAQTPVQYGILSGPMQSMVSQGNVQRSNSDADRWQRATGFQKGLIPSPQTPMQVMHKAEKKYEVGKVSDEEEAKQRRLKAILNKLTPQNFEKLFEQVKAVNIDNAATLTGVISQIFDKALMEPTFCEMYANFCFHLAGELPDFSEDDEKITFKRLLLNKCQEEFERGEREQEEANRAEQEGEVKQSEEVQEEKRIQARRRMLGNIRLIGELYKKKMLTERIMHECIKKLLGQYQTPDEEDIEALCKLMITIGEIIDHPKAKVHMDAYFDRMVMLSNNMNLSSRVRFMLKDSIDLRKNKWQQRRKVEGPKKIDEVHRDAAQERQAQSSRLARGPSIGSSVRRGQQPMDYGHRGSNMLSSPNAQMGGFRGVPTQLRGYGAQDVRSEERPLFENRTPLSVPLTHRPMGDDYITLGPQGGLARGMSSRGQPSMSNAPSADTPHTGDTRRVTAGLNGYGSVSDRTGNGPREDFTARYIPERVVSTYDQLSMQERNVNHASRDLRNADRSSDRSLIRSPPSRGQGSILTQNDVPENVLPEERLRDMSMTTIKEFYSAKDEKEVVLCVKELNAPSFHPSMISIWVTDSFERKDMERDLLAKLLINLAKSQDVTLSQYQLIKGFESVLTTLEDAVNDAPKAAEFLGRIFARVILDSLIPFTQIAQLVYEGGEEQGRLVEIGLAAEVVGTILEMVKSEKGEPALDEIRSSSTLRLEKFRPLDAKKSLRIDKFI